jgi:hypothetical protein
MMNATGPCSPLRHTHRGVVDFCDLVENKSNIVKNIFDSLAVPT